MYRRSAQGWAKHIDFIVIDEISLQGAFILSVLWRQKMWAYSDSLYQTLGFIFILIDALVLVLHNSMHNVIQRGYYQEIVATLKHCFYVFVYAFRPLQIAMKNQQYFHFKTVLLPASELKAITMKY